MTVFYELLLAFLLITRAAGLWRIFQGPTSADRMLAAQLFGTTAAAMLMILSQLSGNHAFRDAALVLALLAAVMATAFVRRSWNMTMETMETAESDDESGK